MASKHSTRALRQLGKQLSAVPRTQQRTFVSAVNAAARPALAPAARRAAATSFVQTRGVKTVDFAGDKEDVYGRLNPMKS